MTARGICFVRTKTIGSCIQPQLGCHFYHADLDHLRRDQEITEWSQEVDSLTLVATAALSAGLDYPSIHLILHVDAPGGLVDYAQETGRADRDGLPSVCMVLIAAGWAVSWDSGYRSDFITEDHIQMNHYLQSRICLRQCLTGYLDELLHGRLELHAAQTHSTSFAVSVHLRLRNLA